jgi:hypothetical protein
VRGATKEQNTMILIGTPSYNGSVTLNYMRSVLEMQDILNSAGIHTGFQPLAYESLITRARNYIANEFLRQKEFTHLLFIDADIGFPAEAALRYLRSDKDVVCGIYPVKHLDVDKLRRMPDELSTLDAVAASLSYTVKLKSGCVVDKFGLVPVEYGSTGFMMIKRHVLEKIAEAYPELRYRNAYVNTGEEGMEYTAFFDTAIDPVNRDYLPEDYAFCKRWTALGGEIHADVLSRFIHSGNCDYAGDYPVFLKHFQAGEEKPDSD